MFNRYWQEAITASLWFYRSLKKGDWLWLMVAVIIASATVTVVKQLGETVQQSMLLKASESLGADLVLQSTRPIENSWLKRAQELELQSSETMSVVTMALSQNRDGEQSFQLVQLKGLSKHKPLRGQYSPSNEMPFTALTANRIWVEPNLFSLLKLNNNSEVTLGNKNFQLGGAVRSASLISPMANFAPQVFIDIEQFKAIGLLGPGSRVNYQLNLIGDSAKLSVFSKELEQQNNQHWKILSAKAPSEDLGNSLSTAWLFLDLSALSAVLVAGMSILIASRFYLTRWKNSMALMRAFGASNAQMYRLFAWQLSWIALFSSLLGVIVGYLLSIALQPYLTEYFNPLAYINPTNAIITGFFSGFLVLWTFAWQAFQSAVKTAPIQILKSVPSSPHPIHWFISFALLLTLVSLMLTSDLIHWVLLGVVAISLLFYVLALLLIKALNALQKQSRGWFKIALSNLTKQPGLVTVQVVSVGMVLFVLMLMTFVRQDLLSNWQASLPANTPNAFAINIQTDQKFQVDNILESVQQKTDAPMVRGRFTKLNNQPLEAKQQINERARRLLQREANIAVMATIPQHNEIIRQLEANLIKHPSVSVEQGIAELFNIKLGDTLEFNISGQTWLYQVSAIRKVEWQSFQLNFFFIVEPVETRVLPISYLSNFYLDDHKKSNESSELTKQLALNTPGVLLIDVRKVMQQIQDIMNQASWAVSALYGFTLLASIGVLFTATLASQQSRIQGWLLLRTLGATNSVIIKIGLTEFTLLGILAGIFAASFAQVSSLLISHFLLKTQGSLDFGLWFFTILAGALLLLLTGLLTQCSYLHKNPISLKRFLQ